jgi:putative IMPACT (imprinted ancient) family translation regulator
VLRLYCAGLTAGFVDQGPPAGFAGRPLLTVFDAVVVSRLLVA